MNRRRWLVAAVGVAASPAWAHTPYGQWTTYRRKHLLIGCHRADPRTYELAKALVIALDDHLPEARARVARAPDARRLASLLGTDQLQVALLGAVDAADMAAGRGRFEPYGATPLAALGSYQDRCLVARSEFPERHAWLVASAVAGPWPGACKIPGLLQHPGASAWRSGRPLPPA